MEYWALITAISGTVATSAGIISYAIWNHFHQIKLVNQKITDQTVINLARENNYKMNVALLSEHTGVSGKEAKTKLKYLAENGILATDWTKIHLGTRSYVLPNAQSETMFSKFFNTKGTILKRIESVFETNADSSLPVKALSQNKDAQIINLAIENEGLISAYLVCLKLNITIDEAQKRLEDLRQKQIFISEVGQNGGLSYRLLKD